jgi:hypothetical protein
LPLLLFIESACNFARRSSGPRFITFLFTHMCRVTAKIRDCHRVELRPRPHTDTAASCRLFVCGGVHVSLQPLLMSTGWTAGVPVITVTIAIRSSDTDVYSFNSKRMGKQTRSSKRDYHIEHGRLEQQMTAQYYLLA